MVNRAVNNLMQAFALHPLDQEDRIPSQLAVLAVGLLAYGVGLVSGPVEDVPKSCKESEDLVVVE